MTAQPSYNAHNLRVFKPRFGLAGDASGDGLITEADLGLLQQALRGDAPTTMAMDCNQDGVVDQRDTACIARKIGGSMNQGQTRGRGHQGPPTADTHAQNPVQVGWVLFTHDEQGRLIGEYDEQGNPLRRYVWLNDTPVALIDQTGIHYIHTDHLNTPQAVTDSNGTVVWAADYAPFGEVTETVSQIEMNLRFPGQYHDRETGLHQNWHREYAPHLGRYTQSDPIGLRGGLNTFTYAALNPTRLIDPLGLETVPRSPSPTRSRIPAVRIPGICSLLSLYDSSRAQQQEAIRSAYGDRIYDITELCDRLYTGCWSIEDAQVRNECISRCSNQCTEMTMAATRTSADQFAELDKVMPPNWLERVCNPLTER